MRYPIESILIVSLPLFLQLSVLAIDLPAPLAQCHSGEDNSELLSADAQVYGEETDFTVALWARIEGETSYYPALLSNKDWASGHLVDLTTINNAGVTLSSGNNRGWVFTVQPTGAWAWNVGNGEGRLDYLPTAVRQNISDGQWHLLVFSLVQERNEARLYLDGKNVAIYSMNGFNDLNSGLPTLLGQDGKAQQTETLGLGNIDGQARSWNQALTDDQVFALYRERFPGAQAPRFGPPAESIKVMAWNIWHGGRHNGLHTGVRQTVEIIRDSAADIICMQETYGSGPIIADRLGYYFYLRSSNLSVMSRYPLGKTFDLYEPFRFGGVEVRLSDRQRVNVFSLWIHYLPSWRQAVRKSDATPEVLVDGEWTTRAQEITEILATLAPFVEQAGETPLIVAGDFNSPSHLDWTEATRSWHNGLAVPWPVSKAMHERGFVDAFRSIHTDPTRMEEHGNWKGGAERLTWRIDYVYTLGKALKAVDTQMWNQHEIDWPSDHPAVITTIRVASTKK